MKKLKEIPSIDLGEGGAFAFSIRSLISFNYDHNESNNPELPHRHNFHELIWIRSGRGVQIIDDVTIEIFPAAFYLIARGQVHHFLNAENINGFVLRFSDEFSPHYEDKPGSHFSDSFFNNVETIQILGIDNDRVLEFDRLLSLLLKEYETRQQFGKDMILRNLLQILLIKIAQNLDHKAATEDREHRTRDTIFIDFLSLLEKHYVKHHDVAFYANALSISPRQLSERTKQAIGRTAKQVIDERLVLEAKRTFRFTESSVKEVAYNLGYDDPSHFSKAFKKVTGHTPQQFQDM